MEVENSLHTHTLPWSIPNYLSDITRLKLCWFFGIALARTDQQQRTNGSQLKLRQEVAKGGGKSISALFKSSSCLLPIEGCGCPKIHRNFHLQVLRACCLQPFAISVKIWRGFSIAPRFFYLLFINRRIKLNKCHPTSASKKNQRMAYSLQGLWLIKGSVRWLLEGFSSVRASFLQVSLKIFEKSGMDRRDNNGIAGSPFFLKEVNWGALDCHRTGGMLSSPFFLFAFQGC